MQSLSALIIGLVIFLGGHVVTRLPGMRERLIAHFGENMYRALYSLVALMGLAMIAHGYGVYRAGGYIPVWEPPRFFGHIAILLVWPAMILLAAAYLPGAIKHRAKHPMLAGIKLWAFGHLLANGDLGSILLFGSFLAWGVMARIALKRQARGEILPGASASVGSRRNDILAVAIGTALTAALIFGLHRWLIGVAIIAKWG
jgi:uncharacterized membrane protein